MRVRKIMTPACMRYIHRTDGHAVIQPSERMRKLMIKQIMPEGSAVEATYQCRRSRRITEANRALSHHRR